MSKEFGWKKEMATATLAIHPPLIFVGILAVQELIGSDDPDTFHFLVNRGQQILKKRSYFLSGTAAGSGSRDSGTELADSVIESARRHTGGRARVAIP